MRTDLFWILSFCGFAAVSIACGLLAWPQLASVWPGIQEQIDRFHRLHPLAKLMLLVFIAGFIAYGSTKTNQVDQTSGTNIVEIVEGGKTNAPPMMLMTAMPFTGDEPPIVTPEDAARGYQLVEVRTNAAVDYTMPEDAVLATNWWVRGACEDVKRLDFNVWRFPFGSNEYDSAWAFAWGKLRFELADTNEIVAVGALMSAVPYRSRLWAATDTNGSRFVTWESFFLNRDTNTPVNAQVELSGDGDFVTRSNGVEKVFHRIDPDDWDGDGWRNGDDPDPYVWDEYWDDFYQELPEGANEDAYCWIEIRPRWNSEICFCGDGSSNLDDPYLWAKAGETYRVQLLIGKAYTIVSSQPLDVVGQSSPSIEVDGSGTCEIDVVWPVDFSALESNGSGFRMVVRPSGLGGFFSWTDSCCTVYGSDHVFRYGCSGNCGCSGCYAHGYYEYEGYRLETTGGWCGCSSDDDDPGESPDDQPPVGVSVSFSKRAIIFEDAYANTTNDIVPWNSTATELTCTINGGPNGGYVQIDISGGDNLVQYTGQSLPYTRTLAPNERIEFTNRYKATMESSSEDDIEVTATFVENETGWVDESEAKATAVRVKIEPAELAPENESIERHKYGVCESVDCTQSPSSPQINWVTTAGTIETRFGGRQFKCPIYAAMNPLKAMSGGAEYTPVISIVEPNSVEARDAGYDCFNAPYGEAGSIALKLKLYIGPFDVNFAGVRVEEVPNNNGYATGYFNRQDLQLWWSHTRGNGAGIWLPVTEGNKMGGQNVYDQAGLTNVLSRVNSFGMFVDDPNCLWSDGSIIMPNPFGWNKDSTSGETPPHDTFAESTIDIVEIRFDGRCRIWKLGNEVIRYPSGAVYLNGGFQQ